MTRIVRLRAPGGAEQLAVGEIGTGVTGVAADYTALSALTAWQGLFDRGRLEVRDRRPC